MPQNEIHNPSRNLDAFVLDPDVFSYYFPVDNQDFAFNVSDDLQVLTSKLVTCCQFGKQMELNEIIDKILKMKEVANDDDDTMMYLRFSVGSALELSVLNGHNTIVKMLLEHFSDKLQISKKCIYFAILTNQYDIVKMVFKNDLINDPHANLDYNGLSLIEWTTDIQMLKTIFPEWDDNQILAQQMTNAAIVGDIPIIESVLNKGVNINAKNKNGLTALETAALHTNDISIKWLIENGATIDPKSKHSQHLAPYVDFQKQANLLRRNPPIIHSSHVDKSSAINNIDSSNAQQRENNSENQPIEIKDKANKKNL